MNIKTLKQLFKADYQTIPAHWLQDWLLYVIEKPSSFLISNDDYILTNGEMEKLLSGIEKMQAGTPLAYLTGKQEFWSLTFLVNEHTLIPRPDTEILIEYVLQWIQQNEKFNLSKASHSVESTQQKLLDLGTGSGCIAISLAHELPNWQITGVDFSEQALAIAEKNIAYNQQSNINLLESSWYQQLKVPECESEKFSVIVSNPPYIDKHDEHLTKLISEPLSALVADNHGLSDIEKIISDAKKYLKTGGLLVIEHGYNQSIEVKNIFSKHRFGNIETVKDYGSNDRITAGVVVI